MPGAQIPTDVSAELKCYPVWWPAGQDWLSILLGQIAETGAPFYWDGNPTEQEAAAVASLKAFYETLDKIAQGGCFMVGEVKIWPSADVPNGWQACDGTFFPVDEYSELFAVVGYSFGSGMGGDVFAVPDWRRRVPVGLDTGQSPYDQVGNVGGESAHTLTVAEMPAHRHALRVDTLGSAALSSGPGRLAGQGVPLGRRGTGTEEVVLSDAVNLTGGGDAHNNLQPYLVTNYIIYTGVFILG